MQSLIIPTPDSSTARHLGEEEVEQVVVDMEWTIVITITIINQHRGRHTLLTRTVPEAIPITILLLRHLMLRQPHIIIRINTVQTTPTTILPRRLDHP